jgi:hypothetical protein
MMCSRKLRQAAHIRRAQRPLPYQRPPARLTTACAQPPSALQDPTLTTNASTDLAPQLRAAASGSGVVPRRVGRRHRWHRHSQLSVASAPPGTLPQLPGWHRADSAPTEGAGGTSTARVLTPPRRLVDPSQHDRRQHHGSPDGHATSPTAHSAHSGPRPSSGAQRCAAFISSLVRNTPAGRAQGSCIRVGKRSRQGLIMIDIDRPTQARRRTV